MIADMLSNKKINPIVTELIFRRRKLNISLIFITQSSFAVPKNIRLNSTRYFAMKISKLHLIIYQIMTFKTLWIFIKCLLQNHIPFWLLILLLHQIIIYPSRYEILCDFHRIITKSGKVDVGLSETLEKRYVFWEQCIDINHPVMSISGLISAWMFWQVNDRKSPIVGDYYFQ